MLFEHKQYIIFGGSSGIGLATAQALIKQGARVIIVGRSEKKLLVARESLGGLITTLTCDIADEKNIASLFDEIEIIDGIACTAGETPPGAIHSLSTESAMQGFRSKFWGQYFIVKYGVPKLSSDGSVVLTSGAFSVRPVKNVGVLSAVNGAIESFVRAMAMELAPIRINGIAPGLIDTDRLKMVSARDPKALEERLRTQVPLKRLGQGEEVAQSVLYLLSNSYTTGSILYVDGGITLR